VRLVHAVDPVACVGAHEADIAKDAVLATEAVVANELETALVAQLLVPNNDPLTIPINDPVKEPVLIWVELLTNPTGTPVSDDHAVDPVACVGAHEADNANIA
jgi:hypothetical protein